MQTSLESIGNLERRLTFSLPQEDLASQLKQRLQQLARTTRINGFRPGKVPANVIQQRFGAQVHQELLTKLVRETFDSAIRDHALQLVGTPHIDRPNDDRYDFVATFEVMPDFGDLDVTHLVVTRPKAQITEADIDQMIDNLRLQRRRFQPVERPAQLGDLVHVRLWTVVDGVRIPEDGDEQTTLLLGSGNSLPAIENGLLGLSATDNTTLTVAFPEQWPQPTLAGQTGEVHASVTQVSEPVLPEVDAAFIQSFGVNTSDLAQFRREILANLERELSAALQRRLRHTVCQQLVAAHGQVELPAKLVNAQARRLLANQQNKQSEQDQDQFNQVDADAHLPFIEQAREQVLIGLLLSDIARRQSLTLDRDRLNDSLRLLASTYEQPEQVIAMYRQDRQLMANLQNRIMEDQVIDWIADHAQQTDQPLTFQEAIQPPSA